MFELLPGKGLVLPHRVGVLTFGMSERSAQWVVASLADVRETWVCQAGWAFTAAYEGLELCAYGDYVDRECRSELDRNGLAGVSLRRCQYGLRGPSAVPVVLDGSDVFGYPATEVLDALSQADFPGVRLRPSAPSPGTYVEGVRVDAVPAAQAVR